MTIDQIHEMWMWHALDQAQRAFEADEVPVGTVVVDQGRIIGEGYNQRESLNDPPAHAEMIAITQAAEQLQSWRLIDSSLYVTLEPYPMCAGVAGAQREFIRCYRLRRKNDIEERKSSIAPGT